MKNLHIIMVLGLISFLPKFALGDEESSFQPHQVRYWGGPSLNIHQYEATQIRFGGAYDYALSPRLSLGIPASYAILGGFSSLQSGLEAILTLAGSNSFSWFEHSAVLFEWLSGNGRTLYGGTIQVGTGIQFQWTEHTRVWIEPISIQWMPLTSNTKVPWSLRGEAQVGVSVVW